MCICVFRSCREVVWPGRQLCREHQKESSCLAAADHPSHPLSRDYAHHLQRYCGRQQGQQGGIKEHTQTHRVEIDLSTHISTSVLLCLQKLFLDSLRKALSGQGGNKQLMESAAIACVKLCKASTYINWEDHSTIFLLVQSIVMDLKVRAVTSIWILSTWWVLLKVLLLWITLGPSV